MALLTGDKRTATVKAACDVTVFEVPSSALRPVLQKRPEIIDSMSALMAKRQIEEVQARADASSNAAGNALDTAAQRLAGRVKEFFALKRDKNAEEPAD